MVRIERNIIKSMFGAKDTALGHEEYNFTPSI